RYPAALQGRPPRRCARVQEGRWPELDGKRWAPVRAVMGGAAVLGRRARAVRPPRAQGLSALQLLRAGVLTAGLTRSGHSPLEMLRCYASSTGATAVSAARVQAITGLSRGPGFGSNVLSLSTMNFVSRSSSSIWLLALQSRCSSTNARGMRRLIESLA